MAPSDPRSRSSTSASVPFAAAARNAAASEASSERTVEPMSVSNSAGKPAVIVVMGVASSGKTSLGERLAERLGWPFRDADSFHPPENVAKMSSGTPLTDEDRKPWLAAIAAWTFAANSTFFAS